MSIPSYKRGESSLEFLNNLRRLRRLTNQLLEKDFGIKQRTYDINLIETIYNLSEEDKQIFIELSKKYGMNSYLVDKYPEWLINDIRHEIRSILKNIAIHIELANSIYIFNEESYNQRRSQLDRAIGYCNALKDSINELLENFDMKPSQLEELYIQVEFEIKLLKGVRTADRKRLKEILKKKE